MMNNDMINNDNNNNNNYYYNTMGSSKALVPRLVLLLGRILETLITHWRQRVMISPPSETTCLDSYRPVIERLSLIINIYTHTHTRTHAHTHTHTHRVGVY